MSSSANDDIASLLILYDVNTDENKIENECLRDRTAKESFLSLIDGATQGEDLPHIIELLPNSSLTYVYSLTMNATVKIIACHGTFKHHCSTFYTVKKV
jgi:hypothetical protein